MATVQNWIDLYEFQSSSYHLIRAFGYLHYICFCYPMYLSSEIEIHGGIKHCNLLFKEVIE